MAKEDISLLLGGGSKSEPPKAESDGPSASQAALKALFKAAGSNDWAKAEKAWKTLIEDDEEEETEPPDEVA